MKYHEIDGILRKAVVLAEGHMEKENPLLALLDRFNSIFLSWPEALARVTSQRLASGG